MTFGTVYGEDPSGEGPTGRSVRLALCGLTPFDDGIVSELVRDVGGIEIVARMDHGPDLRADFAASGADLMVCAMGEAEMDALWDASVRRQPAVLNLMGDHTTARLYVLETRTQTVEGLSEERLVEAILGWQRDGG